MLKLRTSPVADGFTINVRGASFVVCPLSSSAKSNLRAKYTKVKGMVEKTDSIAFVKEQFDRTVKSWGPEVCDESGTPLDCTSENKRKLCEYSLDFVNEVFEEIDAVEASRREGEGGNSGPGQSGPSPQEQ